MVGAYIDLIFKKLNKKSDGYQIKVQILYR